MGCLGLKKEILIVFLMCFILVFACFVSANQGQITNTETQLNAPGFSEGNAFSFGFDDTVNAHTGNLIITSTDVSLAGRNGLGVAITRQYDSNVFLHWTQCPKAQTSLSPAGCTLNDPIDGPNCPAGYNCDNVCTECLIPGYEPGTMCCEGIDNEAMSLKSPGWLGIGWDINLGKIKDPTQLLVDAEFGGDHDFIYGVPEKGINSLSLVLGNTETQIILPYWFESEAYDTEPLTPQKIWGSDLRDGDDLDNIYTGYTSNLAPVTIWHDSIYDYVPNIPPNDPLFPLRAKVKAGIPLGAEYYSGGTKYLFNHYVPFCAQFDDIPYDNSNPGRCIPADQNPPYYEYYKWAENKYAGLYLTAVVDSMGNYMTIEYPGWHGSFLGFEGVLDVGDIYDNSPFISKITDSLGREMIFCTADPGKYPNSEDCNPNDPTNNPTINGRLRWIKYPNYQGTPIYVVYYYTGSNDELLDRVEVWANALPPSGQNMQLTTSYDYYGIDYFEAGLQPYKALQSITYPTGAVVEYDYRNEESYELYGLYDTWKTTNFFTYNYISMWEMPTLLSDAPENAARWAVHERRVKPNGVDNCPLGDSCNECSDDECFAWLYDYDTYREQVTPGEPLYNVWLVETAIQDPLGNYQVQTAFPAAHMPIKNAFPA
jgi:hypothetical protein